MYIHIHTYIYIYIYTYIYILVYIYTYILIFMYVLCRINIPPNICLTLYINTCKFSFLPDFRLTFFPPSFYGEAILYGVFMGWL